MAAGGPVTGGLETGSPGRGAPLGIPGARAAPPPRPAPPRRPFPPGALPSLPAGSEPGLRPRRHVTEQARPAGSAGRRRGRAGWAPSVESRRRRRQEPAAFSGRPVAGARRLSLSGDSRAANPGFHEAGLEFRVCGWTRSRTRGDGARYCAPGLGTQRRDPVTMGTDALGVPGLEPGESQRFLHSDQARPLGGPSAGGVARWQARLDAPRPSPRSQPRFCPHPRWDSHSLASGDGGHGGALALPGRERQWRRCGRVASRSAL